MSQTFIDGNVNQINEAGKQAKNQEDEMKKRSEKLYKKT